MEVYIVYITVVITIVVTFGVLRSGGNKIILLVFLLLILGVFSWLKWGGEITSWYKIKTGQSIPLHGTEDDYYDFLESMGQLTPRLREQRCEADGGEYKMYKSECPNWCQPSTWCDNITPNHRASACDCGEGRCWDQKTATCLPQS